MRITSSVIKIVFKFYSCRTILLFQWFTFLHSSITANTLQDSDSQGIYSEFSGAPNDGFLLNTMKTLFRLSIQSTLRPLEMHSERRYKICICSVILG